MSGPWYKKIQGVDQGDRMREENEGKYGHGAFKDEPYRFTTIEQKLSGVRMWYDKVRARPRAAGWGWSREGCGKGLE